MIILLLTIIFLSIISLYLHNGNIVLADFGENEDNYLIKQKFCFVAGITWTILSGFRHEIIGADTIAYGYAFENIKDQSWSYLGQLFFNTYFRIEFSKDPGYGLLEKIVQIFTEDYRVFLILIAIFLFVSMGIWIAKYSKIPYISFLLFTCLFYSFYAITGHRQTIATILTVFIGDKFIRERKLLYFLIITLVAATIHKSCLCFIPAYFLYQYKNYTQKIYIISLIIGILCLYFSQFFWIKIANFLHYENFLYNEIGGTGRYVFIYLCIIIVTIIQFPSIVKDNPEAYGTLNIMLLGTLMVIMAYFNQSFMRVQQYYTLYLMLLLPEIVMSFKGRDRMLVASVGCLLLIILMIHNNPRYYFCWQSI